MHKRWIPVRSTFQWREYSFWATNHLKVSRKAGFHHLFLLPKPSLVELGSSTRTSPRSSKTGWHARSLTRRTHTDSKTHHAIIILWFGLRRHWRHVCVCVCVTELGSRTSWQVHVRSLTRAGMHALQPRRIHIDSISPCELCELEDSSSCYHHLVIWT